MKLEPCIPPVWAATAHLQTILGHLLPSPKLKSKGKRVEIPVSDGDRLVAFIEEGESDSVVYVFHGLAGSTDSTYVHRTSILAQQLGHTVFLVNHRGCGEGAGLAKGLYHSGRGEDLAAAIAYGRKLFPSKRHVAVGYSMSGNALLLLLSGRRGDTRPDAAISVNAPIALEETSFLLGTGFNRIYDIKFYLQCRRDVFKAHSDPEVRKRIPRLSTIREFDNYYTAPFGGFKDREDYYSTCSTQALLKDIQVPTILLMSKDDPFVPFSSYEAAALSPNVLPHFEEFGGHMGYITRESTPLGTFRWQDYAVREALKNV
jgi:predicted alpha/beta-fold hydrolase